MYAEKAGFAGSETQNAAITFPAAQTADNILIPLNILERSGSEDEVTSLLIVRDEVTLPAKLALQDPKPPVLPKPKRAPSLKVDGRKRNSSKWITANEVHQIRAIDGWMRKRRTPFNLQIDVNPAMLDTPPDDVGGWAKDSLRNQLAVWFKRRGLTFTCWWVRENYQGVGREHIHLTTRLDLKAWSDFAAFLERRFPGDRAFHLSAPDDNGMSYRLKQCSPQASWSPSGRQRIRRETASRTDGAAVAPVSGKKIGWSRDLDQVAKEAMEYRKINRLRYARNRQDQKAAMRPVEAPEAARPAPVAPPCQVPSTPAPTVTEPPSDDDVSAWSGTITEADHASYTALMDRIAATPGGYEEYRKDLWITRKRQKLISNKKLDRPMHA